MPVNFLSDTERERLNSFPANLTTDEIVAGFTLSDDDRAQLPVTSTDANRLGFAMQLVLLRSLGFYLPSFDSVSSAVVAYLASQLGVAPEQHKSYSDRAATRTAHKLAAENYLGFRHPTEADLNHLNEWLTDRALEHDRPILLLRMLCERFLAERWVRPGLSIVERMVGAARAEAEDRIYQSLEPLLDEGKQQGFDSLLIAPAQGRASPLVWLRESATSNTPKTILTALTKLKQLQQWHVGEWDLSILNPNRRKQLAQIGFRSTNQALQRMPKTRRYPVILAFLYQLHEEVLDELVELFDRNLYQTNRRAERKVTELQQELARLAGDQIKLFQAVVKVLLDPQVSDAEVRAAIYQFLPEKQLQATFEECQKISLPLDENYFELLGARYGYLRRFVPEFLSFLPFGGNQESGELLEAIEILKDLDCQTYGGKRKIPDDAPRSFVPRDWWNQVFDENDKINRKFYELSALFELRNSLRSGDVWVTGSRRYNKIESYLIPAEIWQAEKANVCQLLALPENGQVHLQKRQAELAELFLSFDRLFDKLAAGGKLRAVDNLNFQAGERDSDFTDDINVRLENGKLVVTKLVAEALPESSQALSALVDERLPVVGVIRARLPPSAK